MFFSDPARGTIYMLKTDVSNGFYQISLRPANAVKLGLIFPLYDGDEMLVANPPTLPMMWKNFPHLFFTATDNIADLANQDLCAHTPLRPHNLDDRASAVVNATAPTLDPTLDPLSQYPLLLRTNAQLLAYMEIFVDELLGLA